MDYVVNHRYRETNNAYSLWLARDRFDGRGMLLLDGDILFEREIVGRMLEGTTGGNSIAVRRSDDLGTEEIKVLLDGAGDVARIGKQIEPGLCIGESIGIARFDPEGTRRLFAILDERIALPGGENEFYEHSFQQLIDEGTAISIVDTLNYRCIEIDTPDDLDQAEREVAAFVDRSA